MTTAHLLLLVALASVGVDTDTDERYTELPELARAISDHCGLDDACMLDALATCWVESRCQMAPHGLDSPRECGPFQQVRRYADYEGRPADDDAACHELRTSPETAVRQWRVKRDRYSARHGRNWPRRYNGSHRAEAYQVHFYATRRAFAAMIGE